MKRSRLNPWFVGVLLCASVPLDASAQQAESVAAEEDPDELYRAATTASNAGEHMRAADLYLRVYASEPDATLLFNSALSLGRAGRLPSAIDMMEDALEQKSLPLSGEDAKAAREYIEEWREEIRPKRGQISWVGVTGASVALVGAGAIGWAVLDEQAFEEDVARLGQTYDRDEYDKERERLRGVAAFNRAKVAVGGGLMALGAGLLVWDLVTTGGVPWEPESSSAREANASKISIVPTTTGLAVIGRF